MYRYGGRFLMSVFKLIKRYVIPRSLFPSITILLGFLVSIHSFAKESTTPILSVVTENLPPYQYIESNGELTGYSYEVVKALLEEVGVQSRISVLPWARAYKIASKRKNTLIFSVAKTASRMPYFHWIGKIHAEKYIFLSLKDNQHVKAENLEQVKKYRTSVTRSTVTDQLLTQLAFPKIERTANFNQSFEMLFRKRVDLVVATREALKYYQPNTSVDTKELREVFKLDNYSSDIYIAVNIFSDSELVKKLEVAFKKLENSGRLKSLQDKWGMSLLSELPLTR